MDKLKEITKPIENELNLFEENLKSIIEKENNFLKKDLIEFLFSSPKRLRPVLIFLFSKILNINSELVLKIALITELIHSASLIHDDIIDEAEYRRNLPSFYQKFGAKIAVLEGDFLLSLALEELSKTKLEILNIFSNKIKLTLDGELNQNQDYKKITDEKTYLDKTFNKTGNLFLAGLLSLFALKEIPPELKNNLIAFIKNYSIAFQIQNDIKNVLSDNSDFTNGNYTLPVIYFFMENKNENPNKQNLAKYIDLALNKKDEFKNTAIDFINNIENSEKSIYVETIKKLCDYSLGSKF